MPIRSSSTPALPARLGVWALFVLGSIQSMAAWAEGDELRLVIDGIPDEAAWAAAIVIDDFRRTQPNDGAAARFATRALLLPTPAGLAVAFDNRSPPDWPRLKPKLARDRIQRTDRVNVMVDFEGRGETAYEFVVSLAGAIGDGSITNENRFNSDWDGRWSSAVHEHDDGWQVELLLPWTLAVLGPAEDGRRRISVYLDRVLGHNEERVSAPAISFFEPTFVSRFLPLEVPDFGARLTRVVPYVALQYDRNRAEGEARAGVDLVYKPSGDFQLAATVNPDFGQVESDALVINFDAIEVFFSDKRPFFTENQGPFDLRTPNGDLLVYTRRIGGPRDGGAAAAEIDLGVKLNGNAGNLSYGLFGARERGLGGRDFLVGRLAHSAERSEFGWLSTYSERPALDRQAMVHAFDTTFRPHPHWTWQTLWLATDVRQSGSRRSGYGAATSVLYQPNATLEHQFDLVRYDPDLRFNDLGFQRRGDLTLLEWDGLWRQAGFAAGWPERSAQWELELARLGDAAWRSLSRDVALSRYAEFHGGGNWFFELAGSGARRDDLLSRGNGVVRSFARRSAYLNGQSARIGPWQVFGELSRFREGLAGLAWEWGGELKHYFGDALSIAGRFEARPSTSWLIWTEGRMLADHPRRLQRLGVDLDYFPAPGRELRVKLEWLALRAADGREYRFEPERRPEPTGRVLPGFTVNSFGLQVRYRIEFGPERELYLVYGRGGGRRAPGQPAMLGLWHDALAFDDSEQILAKLRWAL